MRFGFGIETTDTHLTTLNMPITWHRSRLIHCAGIGAGRGEYEAWHSKLVPKVVSVGTNAHLEVAYLGNTLCCADC